MSGRNVRVDCVPGIDPSKEPIDETAQLVQELLMSPLFKDKSTSMVLNALISAYWTAAHMAGHQQIAAEGMVQLGSRLLVELAIARRATAAPGNQNVH
jgi:hypothetical protein